MIWKKFDNYIDFIWVNICIIAFIINGTISPYLFTIYLIPVCALIFVKTKNKKIKVFNIINLNLRKISFLIYALSILLILSAYLNIKTLSNVVIASIIMLFLIFSLKILRIKSSKHV